MSIDFDRQVCPYLPICDPVVDGMVVHHDDNHLTVTFADTLLGPFERDPDRSRPVEVEAGSETSTRGPVPAGDRLTAYGRDVVLHHWQTPA